MKFRMLALTAALVVLWTAAATAGASDQATGKEATGQTPPAVAATATPDAVLPELKFEFDPVVDGTEVTHDFAIQNAGKEPLAITQVKTG